MTHLLRTINKELAEAERKNSYFANSKLNKCQIGHLISKTEDWTTTNDPSEPYTDESEPKYINRQSQTSIRHDTTLPK